MRAVPKTEAIENLELENKLRGILQGHECNDEVIRMWGKLWNYE